MIFISEEESAQIASHELAFGAVRAALIAASQDSAVSFPVVLGHSSDPNNRFTIKSATDGHMTGLKVGSYFPSNDRAGQPRHNSITLVFDQSKGRIGAIVEGGRLNAYRTAAADAVATDVLARRDAKVLALFGTGHQAEFEAVAISRVRSLERVLVVGRDVARTEAFVERLRSTGLPAETASGEQACSAADIIVTVTTATTPLFEPTWVRSGTHVSSMGSDRTGKQELPPSLFASAQLFCDLPEQSRVIGEFQHAAPHQVLTAIGDVLAGRSAGRNRDDQITIFDSSGISLQDLYMAEAVVAYRT
jgi:ornithine cyclodeaminase